MPTEEEEVRAEMAASGAKAEDECAQCPVLKACNERIATLEAELAAERRWRKRVEEERSMIIKPEAKFGLLFMAIDSPAG